MTSQTAAADSAEAKADAKTAPKSALGEAWELGKTVVFALLIAVVLRIVLFQPFTIPSASMEPTLYEGDYIIVSKYSYGWSRDSIPFEPPLPHGRLFGRAPTRGDVIVFKLPRDGHVDYIKRLIGLPGDTIQVKDSVLYINGKAVPREALKPGPASSPYGLTQDAERYRETLPNGKSYLTLDREPDGPADNAGVYVVPAGHYFMMGDNRDNSDDSRMEVGYVPAENLEGKALFRFFSVDGSAHWWEVWKWPFAIRYSRILSLID